MYLVPECATQQVTNYSHPLHHATDLELYVRLHITSTSYNISKDFRFVPLKILGDSDNFERCSEVIPR